MKQPVVKGKNLELRERTGEDLLRELEWKKDKEICFLEGLFHSGFELEEYDPDEWMENSLKDRDKIILSIFHLYHYIKKKSQVFFVVLH